MKAVYHVPAISMSHAIMLRADMTSRTVVIQLTSQWGRGVNHGDATQWRLLKHVWRELLSGKIYVTPYWLQYNNTVIKY